MRYVLHPGYVYGRNDGDRHYIGSERLAALYRVPIKDCAYGDRPGYREQPGDIHLKPKFNGDYTIPQGAAQ